MAATTQLYLITPAQFDPSAFAPQLTAALDAAEVRCVRLRLRDADAAAYARAADVLRPICHARDVALLIADHYKLVKELGLDGVHLEPGRNFATEARAALGPDLTVGVACAASRHNAMVAGERGADYVSFGPVWAPEGLRVGPVADPELVGWWQEMMEVPCVVEGGLSPERAARFVGIADFIALRRSVWEHADGPVAALRAYAAVLRRAS